MAPSYLLSRNMTLTSTLVMKSKQQRIKIAYSLVDWLFEQTVVKWMATCIMKL